jgi:NitT/TauT family transport system permease protein
MVKQAGESKLAYFPLITFSVLLLLWFAVSQSRAFHQSALPSPTAVVRAFGEEVRTGKLTTDLVASLFRVTLGFLLAIALGMPIGLWMGHSRHARVALLPTMNFFRNLSPLAWIPFAILWFGVGDPPAVFLILMSAFFPVVVTTMAATSSIPEVYFRVAKAHGIFGLEQLLKVTLPAIMPEVITMLRVTAGVCWLVVVAAEMIAGRDGLGFAVMDSRNGLRTDVLVAEMIVIGSIGVLIDWVLARLTKIPSVRWAYER